MHSECLKQGRFGRVNWFTQWCEKVKIVNYVQVCFSCCHTQGIAGQPKEGACRVRGALGCMLSSFGY